MFHRVRSVILPCFPSFRNYNMIVDQGHLPSYAALNSIESLASIASSEPSKLEKDVSCPWTGPMEKLKTSAASLICALEGPTVIHTALSQLNLH
ncbi:hypothetical protein BDV98DRAFT_344626 [Pterulicium gracile]|uniref:Uncharacterized protein n=1 Tax=Pterulicium gracile TaxID=1884261 RepID=A0A5C3Q1H5_9AGAR|nr:hypothetical protein BDV98DRAFT_344626 [Pterula gracilis]